MLHQCWFILCCLVCLPMTVRSTLGNHQDKCLYDFKVYVYPLSPELSPIKLAEEARKNQTFHVCQKCIYEQFALEYVLVDFFTQFCGRTYNPEEADFFYLPVVRDVDYRVALQRGGGKGRDPSPMENVLIEAMEKNNTVPWKEYLNVTDRYWHRYNGADHIIAMPAPVTNLRHQSSMRGHFHYMIQLYPPIFVNVEFSRSFVLEYPVCATEKNIVVPYPTTDPDLLSGMFFKINEENNAKKSKVRDKLLFYQGGMHGSCEDIRRALVSIMRDPRGRWAAQKGDRKREEGFLTARYCPIPVGDSPSSKRMYDVMHFGCIPVVLSDELLWAYSIETGGFLNATSFSLQLPQKIVQLNAEDALEALRADSPLMGRLPKSGLSLYNLLEQAVAEIRTGTTNNGGSNDGEGSRKSVDLNPLIDHSPLILILSRIPNEDYEELVMGVRVSAPHYRFYQYEFERQEQEAKSELQDNKDATSSHSKKTNEVDTTHRDKGSDKSKKGSTQMLPIPTSVHRMPDGPAVEHFAQVLSLRKKKGIPLVHNQCQEERLRKGHKYLGNYPCERIKKKTDVKTTQTSSKVDMKQGNKKERKQGGKQHGKRHLLSFLTQNTTIGNNYEMTWDSGESPGDIEEEEEEEGFDADDKKIAMGDTASPPSLRLMMTGLWSV